MTPNIGSTYHTSNPERWTVTHTNVTSLEEEQRRVLEEEHRQVIEAMELRHQKRIDEKRFYWTWESGVGVIFDYPIENIFKDIKKYIKKKRINEADEFNRECLKKLK